MKDEGVYVALKNLVDALDAFISHKDSARLMEYKDLVYSALDEAHYIIKVYDKKLSGESDEQI